MTSLAISWMSNGLVFWKATEKLQIEVMIPTHKKGYRREYMSFRGLSLNLPAKLSPKCRRKIIETTQEGTHSGFIRATALQTKFSLSRSFSRNHKSVPNMPSHDLSTSRRHKTGSFNGLVGLASGLGDFDKKCVNLPPL